MTGEFWEAAQRYADPLGHVERVRAESDHELEAMARQGAKAEAQRRAASEADRTDTVETHTAEVRVGDLWSGGVRRDEFGGIHPDSEGRPVPYDPNERLPESLTPQASAALFGVAPAPKANAEPTPEQALAAAAEAQDRAASVRQRFEEIKARKRQEEKNA